MKYRVIKKDYERVNQAQYPARIEIFWTHSEIQGYKWLVTHSWSVRWLKQISSPIHTVDFPPTRMGTFSNLQSVHKHSMTVNHLMRDEKKKKKKKKLLSHIPWATQKYLW